MAAAGPGHSQDSESNSGWYSVAVSSSLPAPEVTGTAGSGFCSQNPGSGGGPHSTVLSEMTAIVCHHHLYARYKALHQD